MFIRLDPILIADGHLGLQVIGVGGDETPAQRFHTRRELGRADRLGQEIIGAMLKRMHDILLPLACGDEQDQPSPAVLAAQCARQLHAAGIRQLPVDDQQVEAALAQCAQQLAGALEACQLMSLGLETQGQVITLIMIIFQNADLHVAASPRGYRKQSTRLLRETASQWFTFGRTMATYTRVHPLSLLHGAVPLLAREWRG